MTVIDDTPTNKNLLPQNGFKMVLHRAPNLVYWVQKAPIPGLELGVIDIPTIFSNYPLPGEHLNYEELEIVFKVDEDCLNYLEIFDWIINLGKPDNFQEYQAISSQPSYSGNGIFSDITFLINDTRKNVNLEVVYKDAFPCALSGITFDSALEDVTYQNAAARFAYSSYVINKVV